MKGDVNLRLTLKGPFAETQRQAISSAKGVVVTQSIRSDRYHFCRARCLHVFPDYTYRFGYEGKYGNIALFRQFHAPHPETVCYESVADFESRHSRDGQPLLPFPFVLKADTGGGGWGVFLVRNEQELMAQLQSLDDVGRHPTRRFIAQQFISHQGQDLRVVVIGKSRRAYWRCQQAPGEFRNNVGRGAIINTLLDPALTQKGIRCVESFCTKTGINLAAFDVLFDRSRREPEPLLSEINFCFGRKGLGGSQRFYELLNQAVQEWASSL
ncbi:MAG: glutathione synthase [Thermodesulfobacteriota bacterium]|nr:glutathione synthase [Thermodesulfobacteriota bacterium]